jgi:mycofactocin precursor
MTTDTSTAVLDASHGQRDAAGIVDAGLAVDAQRMIEDEVLVEEISIDGMCGVY